MAIQMRRGLVADLDRSRLVAGEVVVGLDNDKNFVGVAKAPSDVIELATKDDLNNIYSVSFEIINGDLIAYTTGNVAFNINSDGDLLVTLS